MGFNKRYISEESIKNIIQENNFELFFNYFNSESIICKDGYSSKIFNEIKQLNIKDKDKIVELINKLK